jgi:hypothetical protein
LGYEKNDAVVSWRSVIFDQPIDDQGKSVILRLDRANIPGEAVDQLSEEKISTYRGYVRGTISYSDYHLPQNVTTPFGFRIVGPDVRDDVSVAFEQSIDNKLSRIVFRNMVDYDLKPLVIDLSATCSENPSQSVWTRIYGDRDPSGDPLRSQTKSILPGEKFAFEREILLRELQKSAQRQETRCSRFKIESMSVGEQYYLSTQRTKNIPVPELYL